MSTNLSARLLRLGVSSCLLGEAVRYDGRDKRNAYICDSLGKYFHLVPFCPEVAVGMGVPRPPIQLVQQQGEIHALGVNDPLVDMTTALRAYAHEVTEKFTDLSGYIFKNNSPSCGSRQVSVFDNGGLLHQQGRGVYADRLMHILPLLPVAGEDELGNAAMRQNFVEQVMVYSRWQRLNSEGLCLSALRDFHVRHTLDFMLHDVARLKELEIILYETSDNNLDSQADKYIHTVMQILKTVNSPERDGVVMTYILQRLEDQLECEAYKVIKNAIDGFADGKVSHKQVCELLRGALQGLACGELERSYYLYPQAEEQALLDR